MSQEKDTQTPYFPVTLILFKDISSKKLSPSAQAVLLYIVRHTVGWQHGKERQRWVRLKVQDFIQGRPTSSGVGKYDEGISISVPATVMASLEECGAKGFIFELDHGRKDGYYTFGLQWKYYASYVAVDEQAAKAAPTSNYRYERVPGKDQFSEKRAEEQRPHYYGVIHGRPRRKSKSESVDGQSSSIIEEHVSIVEDSLQKSKSSPLIIEESEGLEAAPEDVQEPADRKGIESELIDNRIESSVAKATGAPASRRPNDLEEEPEEKTTGDDRNREAWRIRGQIGRFKDDLDRLEKSRYRTWNGKTKEQIMAEIRKLEATLAALEEA